MSHTGWWCRLWLAERIRSAGMARSCRCESYEAGERMREQKEKWDTEGRQAGSESHKREWPLAGWRFPDGSEKDL